MPGSATYYSGPGKVYLNSVALQAQGENGQVTATINEPTTPVAAAMFGRIGETLDDQTVTISVTPFDNWGLLATLYPAFLGISVGATAGVLLVGTRPHGASNLPTKIWTPDGRLYNFVRTAVTKHPDLKLGVGEPLFGAAEITALGDPASNLGTSGFLVTGNAITETAGTDPGGAMTVADFIRGAWTGAWGALAGFGGDGGAALQAEDFWTISVNAKYSPLKVQRCTRHMKLDSVEIMAKARLVGPTHSQLVAQLGTHTLGSVYGSGTNAGDLILTGPGSKVITLIQAEIRGAGFEFGGTKLGTGEIGFVNQMKFTAGAPQPLLTFSA
jgi:hypothetical protein